METNTEEQLISRNSQINDSWRDVGADDTSGKAIAKLSWANPGEMQIQTRLGSWVSHAQLSSLHSLAVLKKENV